MTARVKVTTSEFLLAVAFCCRCRDASGHTGELTVACALHPESNFLKMLLLLSYCGRLMQVCCRSYGMPSCYGAILIHGLHRSLANKNLIQRSLSLSPDLSFTFRAFTCLLTATDQLAAAGCLSCVCIFYACVRVYVYLSVCCV